MNVIPTANFAFLTNFFNIVHSWEPETVTCRDFDAGVLSKLRATRRSGVDRGWRGWEGRLPTPGRPDAAEFAPNRADASGEIAHIVLRMPGCWCCVAGLGD